MCRPVPVCFLVMIVSSGKTPRQMLHPSCQAKGAPKRSASSGGRVTGVAAAAWSGAAGWMRGTGCSQATIPWTGVCRMRTRVFGEKTESSDSSERLCPLGLGHLFAVAQPGPRTLAYGRRRHGYDPARSFRSATRVSAASEQCLAEFCAAYRTAPSARLAMMALRAYGATGWILSYSGG
jgi:hypothetical protein